MISCMKRGNQLHLRLKGNTKLLILRIVREGLSTGEHIKIDQVVSVLVSDFAYSPSAYSRNGGLIGLAAVAIALGTAVIICF